MAKYIFPALFEAGDEDEQGYTVTFPDLQGCITEGDTLEEAIHMAKDALTGYLYLSEKDEDEIPAASNPNDIEVSKGSFITLIEVKTGYVRDVQENKAIKKTLTIPKWLNDAAEAEKINFSQLLQYAIKEQLGIIEKEL